MHFKLIYILIISLPLISCSLTGIKGNGDVTKEIRKVDSFNDIDISGNFTVDIKVGKRKNITILAESNLLEYIVTKVKKNTLYISSKKNLRPKKKLKILVELPELYSIESSGVNDILATGINCEDFDIDVSGACNVEVVGMTDYLDIDISGAADLKAKRLISKDVDIDLSGAANAEIYATKSCDADVSGAGYIELYGNTKDLSTDISGAAKLKRR